MKQSNFDKWLTTEPDFEPNPNAREYPECSCHDWNEELKIWNVTEFCEIHKH